MRYVWNKKTDYVYPYSEDLLAKKNIEEIEEERALAKLKEQQKGDIGFRDGGEAAAAREAGETAEQMRMAQMQQEIAGLKAQLEAKAKAKPKAKAKGKKPKTRPEPAQKATSGTPAVQIDQTAGDRAQTAKSQ